MLRNATLLAIGISLSGCTTPYVYNPLVVTYRDPPIVLQHPPAIVLDGEVQEFRVIPAPCMVDDSDPEC
jgi:hypothetical protein